ncbi:MAG: hypothetical protein ACLFTA_03390 [Candidatus Nanohaloarchaea archaeon]
MEQLNRLKQRIREVEYSYWFDKKEFGKVVIIASLALLVVSVHAIYTIDDAVEQASNSTERMQKTAALVGSDGFKQSMESLAGTGTTIQGESIDDVVTNLEYASESVDGVEQLSSELEQARTTYQWTALIGMLGIVAGMTAIYI